MALGSTGADTTAAAINSILYHLILNPDVYSKLTAEIENSMSNGTLSMPVLYAQAIKFPYLESCINEGMRLHPSVGLTMPRLVSNGGTTISGFCSPLVIALVSMAQWFSMTRVFFGQDADIFNPTRWIDGDNGQHLKMEKTMIQFGASSRTCIGKNVGIFLFLLDTKREAGVANRNSFL